MGGGALSEDELMKNVVARLVVGEHVNFIAKLKLFGFAIRKAWSYSPEAKLEKEKFGEFEADYNALRKPELDQSFSIDSEDGEFLGECGLDLQNGVLRLWLFDKSDIHTGNILFFFGEENKPPQIGEDFGQVKVMNFRLLAPNQPMELIETASLKLSASFNNVTFEYNEEGGITKIDRFSAKIHVSRKE